MNERIYGWYDRADQPIDQPTFNPSHPGPCLYCGENTSDENVRTHSLMPVTREPPRSYFYRTHRTCAQAATPEQVGQIDDIVLESIKHHGD